jgi:phenylacetate-CoA ligase
MASTGLRHFSEIPLRQFQLVQLTVAQLELRLHVDRELTELETTQIVQTVQKALGYPFQINVLTSLSPLPLGPGGKFEQFVSML